MSFSMNVVSEEEIRAAIQEEVKPLPEKLQKLQAKADQNVAEILNVYLEDEPVFEKKEALLQSIENFGKTTMNASAKNNTLLQVSVGKLSKTGDEGGKVAQGLAELQTKLKDLDPSLVDFAKKGLLGKIFNPLRAYFQKYEKADSVIADIVSSLEKGKEVLVRDNKTLGFEQEGLRKLTKILQEEIDLGRLMVKSIENQVEAAKDRGEDPDKIRFITEEVLFPLSQRLMDLQQMQVVNQQGFIAYEVVMKNNKELIRGVDRANSVTISALKIAVTVASALYDQRIVLEKINALNKTTNDIILGTAKMLEEQGIEIQKQAMESSLSVDTLKQSFAKVLSSMDEISNYKMRALPQMKETINQFGMMADEGEKLIARIEKGNKFAI